MRHEGTIALGADVAGEASVKALTSILEPIMIIVIDGFIVISMYLPLFTLYNTSNSNGWAAGRGIARSSALSRDIDYSARPRSARAFSRSQ
jgi:hypothetical protein